MLGPVRIEIDLDEETAERFGFLLREMNAADPLLWTPSALAASIIRQVVEDDIEAHKVSVN